MQPSDPPIADELDELRKLRIVQDVEILRDYLAHQCHMKSLLLDGACKLTLPREQLEKSIYAMHCKILAAVANFGHKDSRIRSCEGPPRPVWPR